MQSVTQKGTKQHPEFNPTAQQNKQKMKLSAPTL